MWTRFTVCFLASLAFVLVSPPRLSAEGLVSAVVVDKSGRRIEKATIGFNRLPEFRRRPSGSFALAAAGEVFNRTTPRTLADGSASLSVPAGRYYACVHADGYLDPCRWSVAPRFEIGDGEELDQRFEVVAGAKIVVRIEDPAGLVPRNRVSAGASPRLLVGVRKLDGDGADPGSYTYHRARIASSDSAGLNYAVTVPKDAPLILWVYTRGLAVRDWLGRDVALNGHGIPFEVSASEDSRTLLFRVEGAAEEQP